jgi:hypothetical protein
MGMAPLFLSTGVGVSPTFFFLVVSRVVGGFLIKLGVPPTTLFTLSITLGKLFFFPEIGLHILESASESSTWSSFDERVLLEPMPDSSSPSRDEAINTGAPNPPAEGPHGPPPYDPNTDPLRVETKKREFTLFVKDRLVHFTERGWKPWQFSKTHDHYMGVSSDIVKSLEIESVSEYEEFLLEFRKNPKLLESLFK